MSARGSAPSYLAHKFLRPILGPRCSRSSSLGVIVINDCPSYKDVDCRRPSFSGRCCSCLERTTVPRHVCTRVGHGSIFADPVQSSASTYGSNPICTIATSFLQSSKQSRFRTFCDASEVTFENLYLPASGNKQNKLLFSYLFLFAVGSTGEMW